MKKDWFNGLTIRNGKPIEQIRQPVWNMIYKWDAWQPTHVEPRFLLGSSVVEKLKVMDVKVPVLILTGEMDAYHKSKAMELVPSAKQVFIPAAGHVSNLENSKEFNRSLHLFLMSAKMRKQ
jgi:pimeloyl-ACP methyl ester carboxylesterase